MRKVFFIFASITTVAVACSDSGSSSDKTKDTSANNSTSGSTAIDSSNTATNQKGLALVAKHACFACHQVSQKVTGPSYMEVAARYPDNPAVVDSLAQKII